MYRKLAVSAALIVALVIAVTAPSASAEEMKKLTAGDITVTYPAGLEDKAKELADFATEKILPARDRFLRARTAFSDTEKVSRRIVELLGCPEHQEEAEKGFAVLSFAVDSAETVFTDIRLYREADLRAAGGLREGPIVLSYDRQSDRFQFRCDIEGRAAPVRGVFLPVVLKDDGTFHCGDPLDTVVDYLSNTWTAFALSIPHESADHIVLNKLKLRHPFTRWFNEGVANWVDLRIVEEFASDQYKMLRDAMMPDDKDKSLRSKINLVAWLQAGFMPGDSLREKAQTNRSTEYAYATEVVDRMLGAQPPDTLTKILGKLKGKDYADTDVICAAIKDVTGRDAKAILLEYVPAQVKAGLASNQDITLYEQAKGLLSQKNYKEICRLLQASIEIRPSNMNTHFNLAWAMRKAGAPNEVSEAPLKVIAPLSAAEGGGYRLYPLEQDEEALYLLGRMLQDWGLDEKARALFHMILEKKPSHADAAAALRALDKKQADGKQ